MKVASITALSPTVTPWKDGQTLESSSWSVRDFVSDLDGAKIRIVSHYSTEMVEFVDTEWDSEWHIYPLSVGMDSMTDKKGTTKLCETVEAPIRLRKGLWINIHNGNAIMHRDAFNDGSERSIVEHNRKVNASK